MKRATISVTRAALGKAAIALKIRRASWWGSVAQQIPLPFGKAREELHSDGSARRPLAQK